MCLNTVNEDQRLAFKSYVSDNHCFTSAGAAGNTCAADVGNPAVCTTKLGNLAVVGLNGDILKSDEKCRKGKSHIFIDTSTYLDWIGQHTKMVYRIHDVSLRDGLSTLGS